MTQICKGGDLERTLQICTGYEKDKLTLIQTKQGGRKCYETVWSAAGEEGEQICRCLILDDGNYHYAVTVMAFAEEAGKYTSEWQHILNSATLSTD